MLRCCLSQLQHCDLWSTACPKPHCASSITVFTREQAVRGFILCLLDLRSCQHTSRTNSEQHCLSRKCDVDCTQDTNGIACPLTPEIMDSARGIKHWGSKEQTEQHSAIPCVAHLTHKAAHLGMPVVTIILSEPLAETVKYRQTNPARFTKPQAVMA